MEPEELSLHQLYPSAAEFDAEVAKYGDALDPSNPYYCRNIMLRMPILDIGGLRCYDLRDIEMYPGPLLTCDNGVQCGTSEKCTFQGHGNPLQSS
ncbi:hypothetical protein GF342_06095 [Candidatus Woesearchaeota archaeon]|nr:hypothetical protein [Candidatus Woesearchaeota archaeon]